MAKIVRLKNDTYIANDIYTEEEIVIGKWLDGKPIYRKVIIYDHPATETHSEIPHNILNLDTIIDARGMCYIWNSWRLMTTLYPADVNTYSQSIYYVTNETIGVFSSSSFANQNSKFYIVLEYTKTID